MRKIVSSLMLAFVALAFVAEDAEARRLGGGRSLGMQRSIAPAKNTPAPTRATPAPTGNNTAAAPKPAGSSWLGPIAGLAAGLGLGWLIGQGGFGPMMGTLLMIALFGFAVVLVLRLVSRPRAAENNMQYAGAGLPGSPLQAAGESRAAPDFGAQMRPAIPEGFDADGFLRQAKLNFLRLQAANDGGKLDDLREFTSDDLFEALRRDLQEHGASRQQTEVVNLEAELLEVATEGDAHWASVRFSGMIREHPEAQPEPFQEVWNLAKPVSGASGWILAGIQQIQ